MNRRILVEALMGASLRSNVSTLRVSPKKGKPHIFSSHGCLVVASGTARPESKVDALMYCDNRYQSRQAVGQA